MSNTAIPPFGAMRRKEREITSREEIDGILGSTIVMNLAFSDNNVPFLVPVFFAYDGTALYFHSAFKGTKMDILSRNRQVCFEVSVDQGVIESDMACDFEARHRTVIGFGKAGLIDDISEKVRVLDMIVARFTDRKFPYPQGSLDNTAVVRIEIDSIKGKKHGF
jgi:nitroimidazol reductase NimA-like FMN-containing flavoprotein (pyridoxamine 5'-phosphate oxidase superfamily)